MKISVINRFTNNYSHCKSNDSYKKQNKISFGQTAPIKSKYDVLLEKRKAVSESIKKLESEIQYVSNYNESKAKRNVQYRIEEEMRKRNVGKFGGFIFGESKDIEDKCWNEFYAERDTIRYLRPKLRDMQDTKKFLEEYLATIDRQISSYEKECPQQQSQNNTIYVSTPIVTTVQKTNSPHHETPTLDEYTKLCEEFEELRKLDISDPTRKAAAQKLNALEKQMIEQNISFVPKAPESFASDKERWDYLYYRLMGVPVKNEATAIDMLDQFGKLGGKMYDPNTGKNSLMDIGIAALSYLDNDKIDTDSANRILQKYIDSVFKFATNEIPTGGYSPDAAELLPRYHNFTQLMTKDTVIKFINAFKNIAVDKKQYKDIKYFLKDGSWQIFYPKLKAQDLPDIQKALDEFAAAVENLPDDIMKV